MKDEGRGGLRACKSGYIHVKMRQRPALQVSVDRAEEEGQDGPNWPTTHTINNQNN